MANAMLPLPAFFNPNNAKDWAYQPDLTALSREAHAWAKAHNIKPGGPSKKISGIQFQRNAPDVRLLLIDVQKDFCFPKGTLYVAGRSGTGAMDDSRRIAEFIYHNLGIITEVTCTLDTHRPYQIFYPTFWVKEDGFTPADPYTVISHADVVAGTYRVNPAVASIVARGANGAGNLRWLEEYALHYTAELERMGKYMLYLWPFHCMFGTEGHNLVGVVSEAAYFHACCRAMQVGMEVKGSNPLSERYSVFKEEVMTRHDGRPLDGAQRNVAFMQTLLEADRVVIAGQAASHCVKSSIEDLLDEILAKDATLAKKVIILEDCMSSVVIPNGPDFTDDAKKAIDRFTAAGMRLARSTDPVSSWL